MSIKTTVLIANHLLLNRLDSVVAICRIPTAKYLFLDTALKTVAYPTRLPRASGVRVNRSANLSTNVPDGPMDSSSERGIQ